MSQHSAPAVVGTWQAAQRLKLSRRQVVRLIHAGQLEATRTGPGTAGFAIDAAEVERLAVKRGQA